MYKMFLLAVLRVCNVLAFDFMCEKVQPFIQPLRKWIRSRQEQMYSTSARHDQHHVTGTNTASGGDMAYRTRGSSKGGAATRGSTSATATAASNATTSTALNNTHPLHNHPSLIRDPLLANSCHNPELLEPDDVASITLQMNSVDGDKGYKSKLVAAGRGSLICPSNQVVELAELWVPSMTNFRFDKEAIMRCFY
jgi:hypothetical protein